MVVAIDGPAGAGKSSVARAVARTLGYRYLDSGAMYRCVALLVLEDAGAPAAVARDLEIDLSDGVVLGGRDVSEAIRSPRVSEEASRVARDPEVRAALVDKQREQIHQGRWVVEGRDIGTVVAPHAAVKVFLTASPEERARRRSAELGSDYATVLAEQSIRDDADSKRALSPMVAAPDAVVLDTSELTFDQVVARVAELVRAAEGAPA